MQPIIYYAGTVAGLILLFAIGFAQAFFRSPSIAAFMQRPMIHFGIPCTMMRFDLSRMSALVHLLYWGGTSMYNVIGVKTLQEGSTRAISMAALNVVPLLASNRLINISQILRIDLLDWRRMHASMGLMTIVQTAVHMGLFSVGRGFSFHDTGDIYVFGALLSVSLTSITYARIIASRHYELSKCVHLVLAGAYIVFLWQRLGTQLSLPHLFLAGGSGLNVLTTVIRFVWVLQRNLSSAGWSTAMVEQYQGATALTVRTARKFGYFPGQYVYLWTPSVSLRAAFQSHPFNVAWSSDDNSQVTLYAQTRRNFTRDLAEIPNGSILKVALEGPYGPRIKLDTYKTLIFMSSGAGIVAQTAMLKAAMTTLASNSLRKVSVIWRLDTEAQEDWVGDWISTCLMPCDTAKQILRFKLFVMNNFKRKNTRYGERVRYGVRTQKVYGDIDIDLMIATEERASVGKTLLLVSAEKTMRNHIKHALTEYGSHNMHYQELEFQPDSCQRLSGKRTQQPMKELIVDENKALEG